MSARRLISICALVTVVPILAAASLAAQTHQRLEMPSLPQIPFQYAGTADASADYQALDNEPAENPVTDSGATLGRVLFYDRDLSANGLVSCASCHTQSTAFDDATRRSIGFRGIITERAAMTLVNSRYNPRGNYFRDERADSLEKQVLVPITDTIEMGLQQGELIDRVGAKPWYGPLFARAFGDSRIDENRIAAALAQFVRSITANRSRYDLARDHAVNPLAPFPEFTAEENLGKRLFFADRADGGGGCAACHITDAFVMKEPANNGLDHGAEGEDPGVGGVTGVTTDIGLFRTASLKNIEITAPYMHDGRLADLDAVIEHYNAGIKSHPNLSRELRNEDGTPVRLGFSDSDKAALVAFLKTLTDRSLLSDPRFSDPFTISAGATDAE